MQNSGGPSTAIFIGLITVSQGSASFQIHCVQDTASAKPVTLAGSPVWWVSKVATG